MLARLRQVRVNLLHWWITRSGLGSDAILYALSGVFALVLGWRSDQAAQWQWGYLAFGPYLFAAALAWGLRRAKVRRVNSSRLALLVLVMLGTVVIPLGFEAHWRHAQPEVGVIARSATAVSKGKDPYRTYMHDGHLVDVIPGRPAYESFFPYFPLMSVFGLPTALTHKGKGLTDPRIAMSLMTLLASALALGLLRASREKKIRIAQVLLALPTGALFLSTGGDDMPILALLLLGVVALQRKSNYLAGVSFGVAAAMKLTAWPMAAGALLVARERDGRPAWKKVGLIITAIVVVTVTPFVLHAPGAFVSNVFAFPLGLAGVASPAASALPGHILAGWWHPFVHILAPAAFVVGGYFAARYLKHHWPLSLSQLLALLSVTMLVVMCVASATRIGYVIYPLNFALWSWVCQEKKAEVIEQVPQLTP
ncbi:MAG: glycosyltransferase 87 family protein [Acidimicrobiales bacterium]